MKERTSQERGKSIPHPANSNRAVTKTPTFTSMGIPNWIFQRGIILLPANAVSGIQIVQLASSLLPENAKSYVPKFHLVPGS